MAGKTTVVTPEFRASFLDAFKPRSFEGGPPKYGVTMLFPKGADLSALKVAAKAAIAERWPNGAPKGLRSPFCDAGEKDYDGFEEGMIFVRATATEDNPPEVVDQRKEDIVSPRDIFSGCYCRAVIKAFGYDKKGNKGVSFGLRCVQLIRKGEPLGGGGSNLLDELPDTGDDSAAPDASDGDGFLD